MNDLFWMPSRLLSNSSSLPDSRWDRASYGTSYDEDCQAVVHETDRETDTEVILMFDKLFQFLAWLHGGGKDTDEVAREHHSFWVGWAEAFCFHIPPMIPKTDYFMYEVEGEWHYYMWGRAMGVLTWAVIILTFLGRLVS